MTNFDTLYDAAHAAGLAAGGAVTPTPMGVRGSDGQRWIIADGVTIQLDDPLLRTAVGGAQTGDLAWVSSYWKPLPPV